jgi:hypothetical protein
MNQATLTVWQDKLEDVRYLKLAIPMNRLVDMDRVQLQALETIGTLLERLADYQEAKDQVEATIEHLHDLGARI